MVRHRRYGYTPPPNPAMTIEPGATGSFNLQAHILNLLRTLNQKGAETITVSFNSLYVMGRGVILLGEETMPQASVSAAPLTAQGYIQTHEKNQIGNYALQLLPAGWNVGMGSCGTVTYDLRLEPWSIIVELAKPELKLVEEAPRRLIISNSVQTATLLNDTYH